MSRAPMFVGLLGMTYHLAERAGDADRLLRELQERRSRGEYVAALSLLSIYAGAGDIPAVRSVLGEAIADSCPAFTMSVTCFSVVGAIRNDPEVHRMLVELLGY